MNANVDIEDMSEKEIEEARKGKAHRKPKDAGKSGNQGGNA